MTERQINPGSGIEGRIVTQYKAERKRQDGAGVSVIWMRLARQYRMPIQLLKHIVAVAKDQRRA